MNSNTLNALQNAIITQRYGTSSNPKIAISAIGFGLCALRAVWCYIHRKIKKYPPGPIGIPFFGSFFTCVDFPKYAAYLASNYGPISMIYVGSQPFVFLHSIDLINEVFKNKNALDREWDTSLQFAHLNPSELPTAIVSHKYWAKKRKIFQSIIISSLNSNVLNKVHNKSLDWHVFKSINKCIQQNTLWYPHDDLAYMLFHAIWKALYGSYISYDSKHRQHILNSMKVIFMDAATDIKLRNLGLQKILPSFFTNPFQDHWQKYEKYVEIQLYEQLKYDDKIFDFNDAKWDKHFEEILKNNQNSCVASKLIAVCRKNPDIYGSKAAIIQEMLVFFNAGVDTSLNTAEYGMVLLAKYGQEQEIIYNELKLEFGKKWKMESIEIKKAIHKLHNLRAFVYEVLRLSSVVAIGVAHYNSKCDIWLKNNKYRIPKNSVILSDVPTANRNDPYWHKKINNGAMNLCLNAWLDKNGCFKYKLNKDKMVGFGVGSRDCAGMSLALRSLYLLFAKLILNYKFSLSLKDKNIQIKQTFRFVSVMEPQIGLKVEQRE